MSTITPKDATEARRGKEQTLVTRRYEAEKPHRIRPSRLASLAELPPPEEWPPPSRLAVPSEWALPLFAFGPKGWTD
jgi:hypothetical protein